MSRQAAYIAASNRRIGLRHLGDFFIAGRRGARLADPIAGGVFREMRSEAYRLAFATHGAQPPLSEA